MLNLNPLLELPSLMDLNESSKKVQFHNLEKFTEVEKEKLISLIQSLLKQIVNYFIPSIIELSIFDPEDVTGQHFYSIIICPNNNENYLVDYEEEMNLNIDSNNQLLPNIEFYERPYYLHRPENEKYGTGIGIGNFVCKVGSFNAISIKKRIYKGKRNFVNHFFDKIHNRCFSNDSVTNSIDTYIGIPLFRPVSHYMGLNEEIYNGGALFLAGHNLNKIQVRELVLNLRHFLIKSIFYISYSRKELQAIKDNKRIIELETLHSLKNQVNHEIVGELNKIKDFDDEFQKEVINKVLKFSRNIVNQYAELVRDFDNESSYFDSQSLHFFIIEIAGKLNLNSQDIQIEIPASLELNINSSVLNSILTQLITNAREAQRRLLYVDKVKYEKYSQSYDIKVKVNEEVYNSQKLYSFTIFNSDTSVPSNLIEHLGFITVTEAGAGSTGVGFKIINNFLLRLKAFQFKKNKFFEIENTNNPMGVKVTFKLFKTC